MSQQCHHASQSENLIYTCPMHPEIIQDNPGDCPKCGMALEPIRVQIEQKNELHDILKNYLDV